MLGACGLISTMLFTQEEKKYHDALGAGSYDYSFGLAVASWLIGLIAALVGAVVDIKSE
jgi:hypothetical protein